jgi:hypothetical protein
MQEKPCKKLRNTTALISATGPATPPEELASPGIMPKEQRGTFPKHDSGCPTNKTQKKPPTLAN